MIKKEELDSFRPEGLDDESWQKLSDKFIELNTGDNNALRLNEQKLKDEKVAVQEKYRTLTAEKEELQKQYESLSEQLKNNSPESLKKFYEEKQKELSSSLEETRRSLTGQLQEKDALIEQLQRGVLERDCMAAFDKAIAGKSIDPSSIPYARTMILGENGNKFSWREIDHENLLVSSDGKTIGRAVDEFFASDFGKRFLLNGNSGGGADGSGGGSGGKTMTRAQYDALSPREQASKIANGYSIKG